MDYDFTITKRHLQRATIVAKNGRALSRLWGLQMPGYIEQDYTVMDWNIQTVLIRLHDTLFTVQVLEDQS